MRFSTFLSTVLVMLVTGIACSGGGGPAAPDAGVQGDGAMVEAVPEMNIIVDPGLGEVQGEFDSQLDWVSFDSTQETATSGLPCLDGSDCASGVCLTLDNGQKECAPACLSVGDCPDGWECRSVTSGADTVFLCLPQSQRLCRPCVYNEDCRLPGIEAGDVCVDFGPQGAFCGRDCSVDTCPQGYVCQEVHSTASSEKTFQQCVPEDGECVCTPYFVQNGFKTRCYIQNKFGVCHGERQCTDTGLSECDAEAPQAEDCDGLDQNCDGQTDEGIEPRECEKQFGDYTCKGPEVCEGGEWVCKAKEPSEEKCDGIDNDCDGTTDPEGTNGCIGYYADEDGDGYGTAAFKCLCAAEGKYKATVAGDCNDALSAVNPAADEICNGKDDDCDGQTDEEGATECQDYFKDEDGDGYGVSGDKKCLCGVLGAYSATKPGDCDDSNPEVKPGAKESCDGTDDDCDGLIDPEGSSGCEDYFFDGDQDGYGVAGNKKCLCGAEGKYTATKQPDCDDTDPAINKGGQEICDLKDNNCDGKVDEEGADGCTLYHADEDGDGYGDPKDSECLCTPKFPYTVTDMQDCDDTDPSVKPGSQEVCNGKDDNCDGVTDGEGAVGCQSYYLDSDGDGFGTPAVKCLCAPKTPYQASQSGDCNDARADVYPGAPEKCDFVDNDCNGKVDEGESILGCKKWYYDGDNDGFGVDGNFKCMCSPSAKYTSAKSGDCDDTNPGVYPGAPESCNGKDDDCNGEIDDGENPGGCVILYKDGDNDGYGNPNAFKCYCKATGQYKSTKPTDCDDGDPGVYPGAQEKCDLKDNDCDGETDEDFVKENFPLYDNQTGNFLGYADDDFPNSWFGYTVGWCDGESCSGVQKGRLLPAGDQDWMAVFKKEYKSDIWPGGSDIHGKVEFTGVSGRNYKVCICFSAYSKCDQSEWKCATSINGATVSVEVVNDDSWGSSDDSFLDIAVMGVGGSDYGCGQYSVGWSTWE